MAHNLGYVTAVGSAFLFGLSATLNKIILTDIHPTLVAGLVYLFAGLSLLVIRFSMLNNGILKMVKTSTETEPKFCRKDMMFLSLVVISGSIIAPFFFFNGLNQTTAVNASFLQNAECLFTVLIALIVLKEHANKKEWVGITLIIVGTILLATNAQFSLLSLNHGIVGNVLILGACLFWGLDNNLSKFLCFKEDIILITALKCLIGGSVLLLLGFMLNLSFSFPLSAFPYLLSVGAFSIGFSTLLFMLSLREIGSMKTGAIFSTASLFGALFAFMVLQETFTIVQFFSGLIMIFGIYLISRR